MSARYSSSRSQMLFKIGVVKNFAIFTGKQLCRSLFLIKLKTLKASNFIFFCEVCKTFKDNFFYRTPPVAASMSNFFYDLNYYKLYL